MNKPMTQHDRNVAKRMAELGVEWPPAEVVETEPEPVEAEKPKTKPTSEKKGK